MIAFTKIARFVKDQTFVVLRKPPMLPTEIFRLKIKLKLNLEWRRQRLVSIKHKIN